MFKFRHSIIHKIFKSTARIKQWIRKKIKNPRAIWLLGFLLVVSGLVIAVYPVWQSKQVTEIQKINYLPSGEESIDSEYQFEDEIVDSTSTSDKLISNKYKQRLVIPKMGVDAEILRGGISNLNKGVWLMPKTSTPAEGGNTVVTAHRWKYRPPDPRTFYNIDKLAIGDRMQIYWQGKIYYYKVFEIKTITPDQTEILYPTKEPRLTLFSCTPLFETSHRLVVVAQQMKVENITK